MKDDSIGKKTGVAQNPAKENMESSEKEEGKELKVSRLGERGRGDHPF